MIACLSMYDFPEMQAANDRLWAGVRDGLRARRIDAPDRLTHGADAWACWTSPDLVLGQTCGFPYRSRLHGAVALVGTPDYGLADAPAGYYYSVLVARRGEPADWTAYLDRRLAINGHDSQSGWAAPQNHAAALGRRFGQIVVSGAHAESARLVATGGADCAAIDAVSWRLIEAYRPEIVAQLAVIARTAPTPGLPLITAMGRDPAPLAAAFADAVAGLAAPDREATGLRGLVHIPAAAYLAVPTPKAPVDAM